MALFEEDQYTRFCLIEEGFSFEEKSHTFPEIAHLYFSRVRTVQRNLLTTTGEAESADLRITLQSGQIISLGFDEGRNFIWLTSNKKADIHNLAELYVELARRTFEQRLKIYITQLKEKGYFEYDGCRFFPESRIEYGKQNFDLTASRFLRIGGYIQLRPKKDNLVRKIARELTWSPPPRFSTHVDTDVIFYLLENYFGLQW